MGKLKWEGKYQDIFAGPFRIFFSSGAWTLQRHGQRVSRHDSRDGAKRKAASMLPRSEVRSKAAGHRVRRPAKVATPPAWLVIGSIVDYSSIIGRPPTERALVVQAGPKQMCAGHWVVWLVGKSGAVSVLACQPAASNDAPAEVQVEILAAEVGQSPEVWQRFLDNDPRIDADLRRIGARATFALGALSPDAGHAHLDPPPRWTSEAIDYWSGWLAREMGTHASRGIRDADAWPWDADRPVLGQYAEWNAAWGALGMATKSNIADQTRHDVAAAFVRHDAIAGRVPYAEDQLPLPVVSAPVATMADVDPMTCEVIPGDFAGPHGMAPATPPCEACSTPDGCEEHRRFTCSGCGRLTPWANGADRAPDACTECTDCLAVPSAVETARLPDDLSTLPVFDPRDVPLTQAERSEVERILSDMPCDEPAPCPRHPKLMVGECLTCHGVDLRRVARSVP